MADQNDLFPLIIGSKTGNVVAFGGDVKPERLLAAYKKGAFPWYNEGEAIQWWSPDPRFVLYPTELRISHSMKPLIKKRRFRVTVDTQFEAVVSACARIERHGALGTWITKDLHEGFVGLHDLGYAHSVEVWDGDVLVGGLYGMAIGRIFFGESMFARVSNASKYGFITLVRWLQTQGFDLIDCQQKTDHLGSLGARSIRRTQFMKLLDRCVLQEAKPRPWTQEFEDWYFNVAQID
jgi:leucyl/phenylalanyl-tRNA--protein transferase